MFGENTHLAKRVANKSEVRVRCGQQCDKLLYNVFLGQTVCCPGACVVRSLRIHHVHTTPKPTTKSTRFTQILDCQREVLIQETNDAALPGEMRYVIFRMFLIHTTTPPQFDPLVEGWRLEHLFRACAPVLSELAKRFELGYRPGTIMGPAQCSGFFEAAFGLFSSSDARCHGYRKNCTAQHNFKWWRVSCAPTIEKSGTVLSCNPAPSARPNLITDHSELSVRIYMRDFVHPMIISVSY